MDDIRDRIEIRYDVEAGFQVNVDGAFVYARASFSVTLGIYSGIPSKEQVAENLISRGVFAEDIDELLGPGKMIAKSTVAEMLTARGIDAEEIQAMRIADVLVDEEVVAQSIR